VCRARLTGASTAGSAHTGVIRHVVPDRARVETALAGGPESGGYVAIALSAPRHADRRGERLP